MKTKPRLNKPIDASLETKRHTSLQINLVIDQTHPSTAPLQKKRNPLAYAVQMEVHMRARFPLVERQYTYT